MADVESYQVGIGIYDEHRANVHVIPLPTPEGLSDEDMRGHAVAILEAMRDAVSIVPSSATLSMVLAESSMSDVEVRDETNRFTDLYDGISNPNTELAEGIAYAIHVSRLKQPSVVSR